MSKPLLSKINPAHQFRLKNSKLDGTCRGSKSFGDTPGLNESVQATCASASILSSLVPVPEIKASVDDAHFLVNQGGLIRVLPDSEMLHISEDTGQPSADLPKGVHLSSQLTGQQGYKKIPHVEFLDAFLFFSVINRFKEHPLRKYL